MKIQTFINKLNKAVEKHGNIDIQINYESFKSVSIRKADVIDISGPKDKPITYIDIQLKR